MNTLNENLTEDAKPKDTETQAKTINQTAENSNSDDAEYSGANSDANASQSTEASQSASLGTAVNPQITAVH